MGTKLDVEVIVADETATTIKGRFPSGTLDKNAAKARLLQILSALGETRRGRVRLRVDDSTGVKASGTIACTQANCTAGDAVEIMGVRLTAVAGAAVAASGQYSIDTSDTAVATSLKAAINGYGPLKDIVTADSSSGTVTVTAKREGSYGNDITMKKVVTTAGAFTLSGAKLTGGKDEAAKPSITGTFTGLPTANDTHVIGGVTLTWKASAANENEVTIGADATACALALIAKINAHTKLAGLFLAATGGAGIFTLTLMSGGRLGNHILCTESVANYTQTATSFAPATTDVYGAGTQEYDFGIPS